MSVHEVEEVVVTARRQGGSIVFFVQMRSRNETNLGVPTPVTDLRGARFLPNARIRLVDETGELPPIVFDSAIPPVALAQLVTLLSIFANGTGNLSARQQAVVADALGALQNLKANGQGLRFAANPGLDENDLMAASLNPDLSLRIVDGNAIIYVNSRILTNPRYYGREIDSVAIHELLHLNPDYAARSIARFTRNGARPFNIDRYNPWHQNEFYRRARQIDRIIRRQFVPQADIIVQEGSTANDTLVGTSSFNDLYGLGGNDTFRGSGEVDFLWGGMGDDTYIFDQSSTEYVIYDEGGNNTLVIEGPYSISNVRLGDAGPRILVGIDTVGDATAFELDRVVAIAKSASGEPCVQRLKVGGQFYSLPSLRPQFNGRPEFNGPAVFQVLDRAFPGGPVGAMSAVDGDGDPLTFSVAQVMGGIGNAASWWFQGNVLYTNHRHDGFSGLSRLRVQVSDGRVADEMFVVISWAGGRGRG